MPTAVSSHKTESLRERVITPHDGFGAFREAAQTLVLDFSQSRSLGWRMFVRDTSAMFRQSLLGYVWLLLPPLATSLIWIFLNDQNLVGLKTGDASAPMFILTGTMLWTAFNMAVLSMQSILGEARSVLSKVNFPHESLVFSGICKATLNSAVPALLLIPIIPIFGMSFQGGMLLFPLGFLTLIVLGCAIGLTLVPVAALYNDVGRAVQLGLRFGFFLTPVIFALPASGLSRTLLLLNPVAAPLISSRHSLIGGEAALWIPTICILIASFGLLFAATLIFKVAMPNIIERMNA